MHSGLKTLKELLLEQWVVSALLNAGADKVLSKGLEQAQPNTNLEARNIVLGAKGREGVSLTTISRAESFRARVLCMLR